MPDFIPSGRPLYRTPDAPAPGVQCYTLEIPADGNWAALVDGALLPLSLEESWRAAGDLTPKQTADRFRAALFKTWTGAAGCGIADNEAPFRDEADGADTADQIDTGYPWYQRAADWTIAAFLATSYTPEAAVFYITTIAPFRIQFKKDPFGAIAKIFVNGTLEAEFDTYSALSSIGAIQINTPNPLNRNIIRIEHSGTNNPLATPSDDGYAVQVVRDYIGVDCTDIIESTRSANNTVIKISESGGWQKYRHFFTPYPDQYSNTGQRMEAQRCGGGAFRVKTGSITLFFGGVEYTDVASTGMFFRSQRAFGIEVSGYGASPLAATYALPLFILGMRLFTLAYPAYIEYEVQET